MKRRFVLLDRDGTLIVERGYLSDPAQVELLPGAAEGLRRMRALGLGLVVLTNQSAVGRGYFTLARLEEIHERFRELLRAEGVELDGLYFCPHAPEDDCLCRKPRAGMVLRAAKELDFDPAQAIAVGDKECDLALGRNVGAKTILVETGYGAATHQDAQANFVAATLAEAADWIERLIAEGVNRA